MGVNIRVKTPTLFSSNKYLKLEHGGLFPPTKWESILESKLQQFTLVISTYKFDMEDYFLLLNGS